MWYKQNKISIKNIYIVVVANGCSGPRICNQKKKQPSVAADGDVDV
jgi:hypothetical protein